MAVRHLISQIPGATFIDRSAGTEDVGYLQSADDGDDVCDALIISFVPPVHHSTGTKKCAIVPSLVGDNAIFLEVIS